MTNAPLCALAHLMNALLAGFFELTALFSAILAFLSSCDIILMFETFRLQRYKKFVKFLVGTPTFFANSLRFAGKSDALAELCGRCALHTAEETGEIRPTILSFCVLQLHAALAGCAIIDFVASLVEELEGGLAVPAAADAVSSAHDGLPRPA